MLERGRRQLSCIRKKKGQIAYSTLSQGLPHDYGSLWVGLAVPIKWFPLELVIMDDAMDPREVWETQRRVIEKEREPWTEGKAPWNKESGEYGGPFERGASLHG